MTINPRKAEIGEIMPMGHAHEGWIYMGPDEETGKDFYAAPRDEPGKISFEHAGTLARTYGTKIPSLSQLTKIYRNKDKGALKGTFNDASFETGLYWSSTKATRANIYVRSFKTGEFSYLYPTDCISLRFIRDEARAIEKEKSTAGITGNILYNDHMTESLKQYLVQIGRNNAVARDERGRRTITSISDEAFGGRVQIITEQIAGILAAVGGEIVTPASRSGRLLVSATEEGATEIAKLQHVLSVSENRFHERPPQPG